MIDFYTWSTPNGYKVAIMLEESGLDYQVRPVDIRADEQFAPDFLTISPNNKIPAIVDHDAQGGPLALFESAAILTYLADKTGAYLPTEYPARAEALAWLTWQVAEVDPSLGQLLHFTSDEREEHNPHAVKRFGEESARLYNVLEKRLADRKFVAGEYSIADMALFPWIRLMRARAARFGDGGQWERIEDWMDEIDERAAVGRAYQIMS